jgi:hypothetical protein
VDITREQAADLLYKSQVEHRLIQGGIFQSNDGATFGFLGRIERLDNRSLTIDARSRPHHLSGRAGEAKQQFLLINESFGSTENDTTPQLGDSSCVYPII